MEKYKKRGTFDTLEKYIQHNMHITHASTLSHWEQMHDAGAYRIQGLEQAADLLMRYKGSCVTICGDYDVDGVTATTILYRTLMRLGFTRVRCKIPRRFTDGFGLRKSMIEDVDNGLIITVDNGIAALDAVAYAKEKGLAVIVTDHHMPNPDANGNAVLPDADVIIDPNAIARSADFTGYCGAGLAYKLAACLTRDKDFLDRLITLAAIGTVADVMELREDNWVIVRKGIENINRRKTFPGVIALMDAMHFLEVDEDKIGYYIGPALNANGRIYDTGAKYSAGLLMYDDAAKAADFARRTVATNEKRKTMKEAAIKQAQTYIESCRMQADPALVLYLPEVGEGIVGIVAGELSDPQTGYGVPCIIFTDSLEEGVLKGSARSVEGLNIKEILDAIQDQLLSYGGHAGAAGVSITVDMLEQVRASVIAAVWATGFANQAKEDVVYYDVEIPVEDVREALATLKVYAPFGEGNPRPVFKISPAAPVYSRSADTGELLPYQILGKNKATVKVQLSHDVQAIGFSFAQEFKEQDVSQQTKMAFYGSLMENKWRDNITPQIVMDAVEFV